MKIGLGTGSTAEPAVRHLAARIADGTLRDVKAVVTSFGTQNLCEELEIPVYSMNDKVIGGHLDLTIDGADEVDPFNNVIKGGGAALLREKIVAYNSTQFVIVADSTKIVGSLGTGFRLPASPSSVRIRAGNRKAVRSSGSVLPPAAAAPPIAVSKA